MKLVLVLALTLMTAQAHAFGWFLLGMAVGSGDTNNTTTIAKGGSKYLEVEYGSCYRKYDRKVMVNSGLIKSIQEPEHENSRKKCTNILTHASTYHIKANYNEVKKKLFGEIKK